ncbi:MAG TPA: hypothetical protein EYP08_00395 [Pyrodictiaceae archaeon]|nr:hypothetical protein [Pyrodictiaceae archaeon]
MSTLDEEMHKRIHAKPRPPRYEPITVTEALHKLHIYLKAVIELGSYAFLAADRLVANHIIDLENIVDQVAYQLLMHMSLAVGHDLESAPYATPIYMYVFGVDRIVDSFKDLASLVARGVYPNPNIYRQLVAVSNVIVARVRGEKIAHKQVKEIYEEYAVEILAILRKHSWILAPHNETIRPEDILYVKGFKENVNEFLKLIGEKELSEAKPRESLKKLLSYVDTMLDMLLVFNDLAHYQLKAQDPKLVEELLEMEAFFDDLRITASKTIIEAQELSTNDKLALLTFITRLEDVSDSLIYIIALPAKEEYREILSTVVESGGERIKIFRATRPLKLVKLVEELEDLGASLLAIRKRSEWIAITPYNVTKIEAQPNDTILVSYNKTLENNVAKLLQKLGLIPQQ